MIFQIMAKIYFISDKKLNRLCIGLIIIFEWIFCCILS